VTASQRPAPSGAKSRTPALPGAQSPEVGESYLRWFVELGGLSPDEAVLEPGCGAGRMARPLARYLSSTGSYDGFDVVSKAIESCQTNIASEHPSFNFRHVDVLNRDYNPEGRLDPEEFAFPYPAAAFDFVFLTSVFTHMLPPEVRHYLSEIRRVLRPEGRCLMTFFLLNEESLDSVRAGRATRRFAYQGDGYLYDVLERPEAAVAHREEDLLGYLEQAGFELHVPILYGYWTGRQVRDPGQDIVVVKRLD
jgi:SAM-dependent methyltransferase